MKIRYCFLFWSVILLIPLTTQPLLAGRVVTVGREGPPQYDYSALQQVHSWLTQLPGGVSEPLTIRLYDSEFPEKTLVWEVSGTERAPILIQGVGDVWFSGTRVKGEAYGRPVLILSWVSHITLENIGFRDFDGRQESRVGLKISGKGKNRIQSCRFSHFFGSRSEAAISLYNDASGNLIEQCEFDSLGDDLYMHAIYLNKNCRHNIIRNNTITYCSGEAFMVRNGSDRNWFDGNTVVRCGGVAYYGEWYDQSPGSNEKPSRGNRITRASGQGPAAKSSGYMRSGYIRKVRALNWSRYKWPNYKEDWTDSSLAYYMPDADKNRLVTVADDMEIRVKAEIDATPAYLRLGKSPIYHAQVVPEGELEGARVELSFADTTNRWGGDERYLREIRLHDTSSRPRRFTTPLQLRTLEGDLIHELYPVRELRGQTVEPAVIAVEGAGQKITFTLTRMQGDYDLFILPHKGSLSVEKLRAHFDDEDGGGDFFAENALSSGFLSLGKAASRGQGSRDEKVSLTLAAGRSFWMVISCKPGAKSGCTWAARP